MRKTYDFAVIGAGIAGSSIAAELAEHVNVVILEAEAQPGYHATGRSAAFWEECYGGPLIAPLTLASGQFLREGGFLSPRGALYIGQGKDSPALDAFEDRFAHTAATFSRVGKDFLSRSIPGLKQPWVDGISQPDCCDIDVAALHAFYLKRGRERGVSLRNGFRVYRAERKDGNWRIESEGGETVEAAHIVNAAGAWAGEMAQLAGAQPIAVSPLRRTVAQLRVDPVPPADMPLVLDIAGSFYFKPDAGRIWLSPHDETPTEACDAAPEELDVAQAIARLETVVDWRIEAVERRWAGLRSFAADRLPVFGPDTQSENFYWFAGQGGSGIQTSPAAAAVAASIILESEAPAPYAAIDPSPYLASRFV